MAYIVAATANLHKVEEYRELLADQKVELKSLADYPNFPEVEEDGATFRENAAKKALSACIYCDVPAFADDSGLVVDALNGEPGIYSARYAPTEAERIAKVLQKLAGQTNRKARFVCAIAIAANGEVIETFVGVVEGSIIEAPRGANGFGYDPIFRPEGFQESFAEMPLHEKNEISHRGQAVRALCSFLNNL